MGRLIMCIETESADPLTHAIAMGVAHDIVKIFSGVPWISLSLARGQALMDDEKPEALYQSYQRAIDRTATGGCAAGD